MNPKLTNIYKQIPRFNCKNCQQCCGIIGWSDAEEIEIRAYLKENNIPYRYTINPPHCPYARDNKCEIYPVRPTICRLQGTTEGLPCPNSKPWKLLSSKKGAELLRQSFEKEGRGNLGSPKEPKKPEGKA